MSSSRKHPDYWILRELRDVELPEGLLARLKDIGENPDDIFDATLFEVPLPEGLVGRLKSVSRDEEFDEQIRDLPMPSGLSARLHEIGTYSDEDIDGFLRDVPVPAGLQDALHDIPRRERSVILQRLTPPSWAVAACLLIAVGLSYFAAGAYLVRDAYLTPAVAKGLLLDSQQVETLSLTADTREWWEVYSAYDPDEALVHNMIVDDVIVLAANTPQLVVESPFGLIPQRGPVAELMAVFDPATSRGADPLMDVFLYTYELNVAPPDSSSLPELEVVDLGKPRGVAPPNVPQFNRLELIKTGVHMFVSPSAHPELMVSRVPLVCEPTSYEQTRRALSQNRLLAPDDIRTEDFLAAVDYELPSPTGRALGIRTAAGPSPFGQPGTSMLQVGVQASTITGKTATHLTVALDVSPSMGRGDQFDRLQRALARFASQLGPQDRFSLVTFSDYAEVVIDNVGRDELKEALSVIDLIDAGNATNLGAGLQVAGHAARSADLKEGSARRLVLITDGVSDLPSPVMQRIEQVVRDTAAHGVPLDVINVGWGDEASSRLESLARAGRGSVRHASGVEALRLSLLEVLTGRPQIVARQARLSVTFNPEVVSQYRLLGHEADAMGGLLAGPIEVDLMAGQTATALYEVKLREGSGNNVAMAKLAWRDPVTGEPNEIKQRISRLQFATSLRESPIALQRAVIAAETAEVLRGSVFSTGGPRGLRQILELAETLSQRTLRDPALQELLDLVRKAERVR